MKIETREQYYGYLNRLQELMRDDLSPDENLEFEELVRLINLYEKANKADLGVRAEFLLLETLPKAGEE